MPKQVAPFHSKTGEVYHIYSICTAAKSIKRGRVVKGKANKKLCGACKDIRAGKRPR
ncbi:MAG: hypothetical protein P8X47_05235 [Ignavibacteriaceae bacterium]|jgi:hypothetical protein